MCRLTAWLSVSILVVYCDGSVCEEPEDSKPRSDTQFRGEVELSVPLYEELYLVLGADLRLARVEENRFVRGEIGVLYDYEVNDYLSLVPRYRYRATDEFEGESEEEHRFSINGIARLHFKRLTVSDYNLFEWRLRESGDETRYRNRLRLGYLIEAAGQELEVFVSDEVYYEWSEQAWTRNRFKVGLGKALTDQLSAELYYMKQIDKSDRPNDIDVLGVDIEIEIQ